MAERQRGHPGRVSAGEPHDDGAGGAAPGDEMAGSVTTTTDTGATPPPAPPVRRDAPAEWARRELFSVPVNAVVTVAFGLLLAWAAYRAGRFVLVTADWEVVRRNLRLFAVGRFPVDDLWRVWVGTLLLAAGVGVAAGIAGAVAAETTATRGATVRRAGTLRTTARFAPLLALAAAWLGFTTTFPPTVLVVAAIAVLLLARGAALRLPPGTGRKLGWVLAVVLVLAAPVSLGVAGGVGWDDWGGLLLTLFATVAGILLAFPLGILLAFGRRSRLPVVRFLSGAYIELFRGVPLVALLIISQVALGFFFPTSIDPPSLLARALIVIILFESAYLAEVVRGGLQSVPNGQVEAAQALGLSPWQVVRRIVLPQALRAVLPATVGQFISLFKDTSLFGVVAFLELLRVAQVVLNQDDFRAQGLDPVTLGFVGFTFWAVAYTMSKESRRLEARLEVSR